MRAIRRPLQELQRRRPLLPRQYRELHPLRCPAAFSSRPSGDHSSGATPIGSLSEVQQSSTVPLPEATDAAAITATTATATDTQPPSPAWVRMMNDAIENYRLEMVAMYVACDIGAILSAYVIVDAVGYTGSVDLALALALSRLLRRVRLPLDIGVAALLARAYPPLTQVKISRLFAGVLPPPPQSLPPAPLPPSAATVEAGARELPAAVAPAATPWGMPAGGLTSRIMETVRSVADRYGIAFLVSQRMVVGLASTAAIYSMLCMGLDVQGWLAGAGLPLGSVVGETAGRYAAAMCLGALGFPGVVLGSAFFARIIGRMRRGGFVVPASVPAAKTASAVAAAVAPLQPSPQAVRFASLHRAAPGAATSSGTKPLP